MFVNLFELDIGLKVPMQHNHNEIVKVVTWQQCQKVIQQYQIQQQK